MRSMKVRAAVGAVAALAMVGLAASPAQAAIAAGKVHNANPVGLAVRTLPGSAGAVIKRLYDGTVVQIGCYVNSSGVKWYYLSDYDGYASSAYITVTVGAADVYCDF
ncbi:SH3 domain-containing protein [Micromonospora chokoriensis]|uniref:SH3 domain-containing protein n=1 Tax=Micromonospora chokoriensis TaxID=356851 RepID=UPI0012F9E38B|nr:SH3 domain-containing protein [Micromonospora chokoriensis]